MSSLDKRAQEIAGALAPNTSGVDTRQLLQALAGAYQKQAPTAFAYGMTPAQVAGEAERAQNQQQQQQAHMMSAIQMALGQDKERSDRAFRGQQQALNEREFASLYQQRAHSQGIADRQMKLAEAQFDMLKRAEDIELSAKRANAAKDEALARSARHQADMLSREAELYELASQTMYPVANPTAGQPALDEQGKQRLDAQGAPMTQPSHIQMPLSLAKEYGLINKPINSAAAQRAQQLEKFYQTKGVVPEDASYLAHTDLNKIFTKLEDLVEKDIKNKSEFGEGFGKIVTGTDAVGNPIEREMTPEEYKVNYFQQAIPRFFVMLAPETQQFLQNNLGMLMAPSHTEGQDELLQRFMQQLNLGGTNE